MRDFRNSVIDRPSSYRYSGIILAVAFGLLNVGASQPAATLGPNEALAFDYSDAAFLTYQVSGFQASWDTGAWTALGIVAFRDGLTTADSTSYQFIPPFTNGTHDVSVRACNAQGCGGGSIPFDFAFAVSSPVAVPINFRKVAR